MKTKDLVLTVITLITTNFCFAQNNSNAYQQLQADSAFKRGITEASLRSPGLRMLHISTDIISKGDISNSVYGKPVFKGKAQTIRTSVLLNIPVYSWGKNSVTASGSFFQQDLKMSDIHRVDGSAGNRDLEFNKYAFGLSASFQRRDSLFGKPVFYLASVSGLTNDASTIKKLSGLASVIFTLKQTPRTRFGLGAVVSIDPSVPIPGSLVVNYWHMFNKNLELNVILPSGASLRQTVSKNLWLSLGTSLSGSVAFQELNYPGIPKDINYSTLDLKSGLGIEYRFAKMFVLGANGGILSPLQARAFERNESSKDYFLENKLSNTPYFNVAFSILPFLQKRR